MEIYLNDARFEVYQADSDDAALEMFDNIARGASISDPYVPDLVGIELTLKIRAMGFTGPITILSASDLCRDRKRASSVGCSDYSVKPVSPERQFFN
ncbi:MAG: response regulator [Gammaproteobacteria bacterium]